MKLLGILVLTLGLTLALLVVVGRLLVRRLEPTPRAEAPWGPQTSFLSTRSGRVHVLDAGEGDVVLLVHGSGASVAD